MRYPVTVTFSSSPPAAVASVVGAVVTGAAAAGACVCCDLAPVGASISAADASLRAIGARYEVLRQKQLIPRELAPRAFEE